MKVSDKFLQVYTIIYIVVIHLAALWLWGEVNLDPNMATADKILNYIIAIIVFAVLNIAFLMPFLFVVTIAFMISFLFAISVPLFLFLSLFEVMGSTINIMHFGFWQTLAVCIVVTPIGIMNCKATSLILNN